MGAYHVPGTVWGAVNLWKSRYFDGVLKLRNPRSTMQSCHGVILLTDMDHHLLTVNNDSRRSFLTGSYWSSSCILLAAALKDAYFEDLNCMEGEKRNATFKSRNREVLEPQVNNLVGNSRQELAKNVNLVKKNTKRFHEFDDKEVNFFISKYFLKYYNKNRIRAPLQPFSQRKNVLIIRESPDC